MSDPGWGADDTRCDENRSRADDTHGDESRRGTPDGGAGSSRSRGSKGPDGPLPTAGESVHALRDEFPVGDLSLDEAFGLLADRRRRFALHALRDVRGATDLPRLTERVAEREASADRTFEEPTDNATVRRDLDSRVLPQLDEAGLLDYDARSGSIRYYGHPIVEEYLGHVSGLEWTG